jgi:hypothetical protein
MNRGASDPDESREFTVTIGSQGLRNVAAHLTGRVINLRPQPVIRFQALPFGQSENQQTQLIG